MKTLWRSAVTTVLIALPSMAAAQSAQNPFNQAANLAGEVGANAGLGEPKPLTQIIGSIINVALGFLGIVLLFYLLYAGFLWMTAGGDEGQVKKARTMISQAVVGLIIIVAAFAISTFVLGSLVNATTT
ncbi:MAG: MMCAP2_0565 family pilin-like conjugal transfer protein [Patescibacteria group bacterium]